MGEVAEKKRTLDDITRELQEVLWRIDEGDGVLDDDLERSLDECEEEFEVKVNSILWVMEKQAAMSERLQSRSRALLAKAKTIEREHKRLQEYLLRHLMQLGVDRLTTKDYTVGVYKSPDKVSIEDLDAFLEAHQSTSLVRAKVKLEPVMGEIKIALKEGKTVTGCTLITGRKRLGVK